MMSAVLLAVAAFALMEPVTALTHRLVMHGFGRSLHRSHHQPNSHGWELNDLYPVMFASAVMIALAVGFNVAGFSALIPICIGVTVYGVAYALVHDAYIHGRVPLFRGRTLPVLERLAEAHRVHHRRNGAPYGMLVPVLSRHNGSRPSQEPREP